MTQTIFEEIKVKIRKEIYSECSREAPCHYHTLILSIGRRRQSALCRATDQVLVYHPVQLNAVWFLTWGKICLCWLQVRNTFMCVFFSFFHISAEERAEIVAFRSFNLSFITVSWLNSCLCLNTLGQSRGCFKAMGSFGCENKVTASQGVLSFKDVQGDEMSLQSWLFCHIRAGRHYLE